MIDFKKYIEVVYSGHGTALKINERSENSSQTASDFNFNVYQIDAIINPTDKSLSCFPGENSFIYLLAGEYLNQKCKELVPVTQDVIATDAYDLPVKKIIHLICPRLNNLNKLEEFEKSFIASLELAYENGFGVIAFPTIGFSVYEIPTYEIARIVISNVKRFLSDDKLKKFVCISNSDYLFNLYKMLVVLPDSVESLFIDFIDERMQKLKIVQSSLANSIQRLEKAKNKIELQKNEITIQNELLHEQKQNITDSIQYASRIQYAELPPVEIIDQNFSDNFILYKPCQIVSGDFYWFKQIKNFIYIVAADCTGHGVPGAFMSMLGVSLLNEIVSKQDLNPPNQILNELRNQIKKSLHQTGKSGEQQDGMDIAFCIINKETNLMQFSGAFNPLYLVRNNELLEYKADRMPIGIHANDMNSFTNNIIPLKNGDTIYIFSDGYIDQFGGMKEERFKSKRFKELILSINAVPMKEQLKELNKTFDNWRCDNPQTDDVLVIGIRIS
jgi:serine phosphatase RsbU (regulator of sigma subunit)/O-acetyl-ADP-ribose deacetylase (regulator of RNase III)